MPPLQKRLLLLFPPPHRRGLQADIARLCGVSAPTVNAWFNKPEKVSTIDRANAEKICGAYAAGVSPSWLAEGVGPMNLNATTVISPPPAPPPGFRQRHEVTPSDFALLDDVLLVMTDAEVKHIKERAKHAREAMKRDEKLRVYLGADQQEE